MTIRYVATFNTTLPEECGTIGLDGDEKYAGPAAIAISEILRRIGFDADPPEDAGLDGWQFEVRVKGYPMGVRLYCKVTLIDYHYVMLYNTSWWDGVRKRHPAPYIEALRALGREMAADPRFSDVRWYERNYDLDEVVGAPQPVDDEQPPAKA